VSAWAPLGITIFRVLWIAQLGSNIGTWMQTVGAQWYLVDTAAGATIIALVQTSSLVPSLLLSLPAGVLSDSVDRRRLLIWGNAASALVASVLTVWSFVGGLNPVILLGFTFLLGITAAFTSPAWQAIQPELVPRAQIRAAAGLNGVTVNGARAVGPALAGLLLASFGAPLVFGINALSFVGTVAALIWWRRPPQSGSDDPERFGPALRAGLRYILSAHLVRRILVRSALFAFPASALWALLPLTAQRLALNSSGYGLLLGALGVGAVAGIFVLPAVRKAVSDNVVIAASAAIFAIGTVGAGYFSVIGLVIALLFAGVAWIGTLTALNAALQLTLPQWVRSRGAATYILVFMGAQAIGSFVWGLLAGIIGTELALAVAGGVLILVAVSVLALPLLKGTGTIDRSVTMSWPTPTLVFDADPTDGPVTVWRRYTVKQENLAQFEPAMERVGDSRRRRGASRWRLYRSGEEADIFVESFVVSSWGEYRRQQTQRFTGRDREIENDALHFVEGDPVETHYFPLDA
jgi:MFS family permease